MTSQLRVESRIDRAENALRVGWDRSIFFFFDSLGLGMINSCHKKATYSEKTFLHGFVFEHYHISDIPLRVTAPLQIN